MTCSKHTCTLCTFSMTAQCHACRNAYTGEVWKLGKQADTYIRTEFDTLFARTPT